MPLLRAIRVGAPGAVLVPINFMLNAEEARYILEHCGARVLRVGSGMTPVGREASRGTSIERLAWLPSEEDSSVRECLNKSTDHAA